MKTLLLLAMLLQPGQLPIQHVTWGPDETIVSTNANLFATPILDFAIIDPNEMAKFNIGLANKAGPVRLEVWQTGEPNSVGVETTGDASWSIAFSGQNNKGLHHLQVKATETSGNRSVTGTIVVYVRPPDETDGQLRLFIE